MNGRGHVEFLQVNELPLTPWLNADRGTGLRASVLSTDASSGATTLFAKAQPLWRFADAQTASSDLEVLLLSGDLQVGQQHLAAGDYLAAAAGNTLGGMGSMGGAEFMLFFDGVPAFDPAPLGRAVAPILHRTRDDPWQEPPDYAGRARAQTAPGLGVKFLREDPRTGAYTLMTRHAPGWSDPRLEAHETWEELLLLEGDYLMGATGAVHAGAYIFRPGERPHGPQATRRGAVWFCRGERRIDFQFSHSDWAQRHIDRYLSEGPALAHELWGSWLGTLR